MVQVHLRSSFFTYTTLFRSEVPLSEPATSATCALVTPSAPNTSLATTLTVTLAFSGDWVAVRTRTRLNSSHTTMPYVVQCGKQTKSVTTTEKPSSDVAPVRG